MFSLILITDQGGWSQFLVVPVKGRETLPEGLDHRDLPVNNWRELGESHRNGIKSGEIS